MTASAQRASHWRDWPARLLAARKKDLGVTVSMVIPARDEERTDGGVVAGRGITPAESARRNGVSWPSAHGAFKEKADRALPA